MRILLLSAYDAVSHQYWHNGLVDNFPEFEWTVLSLPARFFSWRIRGNSLTWAYSERATLEQPYDLLITTSMTDLSALRGLVPALTKLPTLVYFHENQFAYPTSGKEYSSVEPQLLTIYSALAADAVVFNTRYNRTTFLEGCRQLLNKFPDLVPKGLVELLTEKSSTLLVPIITVMSEQTCKSSGPLQIIWNHRWEFDKGPELLYQAMMRLKASGIHFTLHVVGQKFRYTPEIFEQLKEDLSEHIGTWGYIDDKHAYHKLLRQCDVILSTALHDFQGVSVLEGVSAGCIPLVPNRLAYPELFNEDFLYEIGESEVDNLVNHLLHLSDLKKKASLPKAPSIDHINWTTLKPHYQTLIDELLKH